MQVFKFGGSSVADATRISRVMDIVTSRTGRKQTIVVCSAISGCTDILLEIKRRASEGQNCFNLIQGLRTRHHAIINRLFTGVQREEALDECNEILAEIGRIPECIEGYGEILSSRIIARKFSADGFRTTWLDSRALICKGVMKESYDAIASAVRNDGAVIFIAPGFIAHDAEGHMTTLGRGGSDYSAAIYAAAVHASNLEIWTDVSGIMTANPKQVAKAGTIPDMSYEDAFTMASLGAKVLYPPTIEPAMLRGIPINIRNTFSPEHPGTVIRKRKDDVHGWLGVCSRKEDDGSVVISVIGREGTDMEGARARVTSCLAASGIKAESVGEADGRVVCAKVCPSVEDSALCALHHDFIEKELSAVLDIYIAGTGKVGRTLCALIEKNRDDIARRNGKILRIAGICNSERYAIAEEGDITSDGIDDALDSGLSGGGEAFIDRIIGRNHVGGVFVDCTDSETIYRRFTDLFKAGIGVVCSNRRSIAVPFAEYSLMKNEARSRDCIFRYQTTVGTSLPVLESISRSENMCDEIESIEAVVSCTLNYLLSCPDGEFASRLRQAKEERLTEDDPRSDLRGDDALRKLLILSREAGVPLEKEDVTVTPVLEESLMEGSVDEFFEKLERTRPVFDKGARFVASLVKDPEAGKGYSARIGLKTVPEDHPAYSLKGTRNLIAICSSFHPSPLLIQGAGEGEVMAASGVLNDILK